MLDRPWAASNPGVTPRRWADDLLLTGATKEEANGALDRIESLLGKVGMRTKPGKTSVQDLGAGEFTDWLGFELHKKTEGGGLELNIGPMARKKLGEKIRDDRTEEANEKTIRGWIRAFGAATTDEEAAAEYETINTRRARSAPSSGTPPTTPSTTALGRDRWGIRSTVFPLNRRNGGRKWPKTRYRRQMVNRFRKESKGSKYRRVYGQRWPAESGLSRYERLLGSALRTRIGAHPKKEILLRVITHNLMLLAAG